jgi:hypothetical protein
MRQIVHIVGIALFCAIAICNAGTAAEITTQDDLQGFIQQHYQMSGQSLSAGDTACSVACAAACLFKCVPPTGTPWDDGCKTCVNGCMNTCTGGSGAIQ